MVEPFLDASVRPVSARLIGMDAHVVLTFVRSVAARRGG
jgi:hypothetical protein